MLCKFVFVFVNLVVVPGGSVHLLPSGAPGAEIEFYS